MVYFIEMWNATDAWHKLSTEERGNYMGQIGAHVQGLMEKGVEILTWSLNDSDTSRKGSYDYFAIWSFPDKAAAMDFQGLVEAAGWYTYFDQKNLMGEADSAQNVIGQLVQL
ncbi:MAG: DUF6616 family protein [Bacteroidota bacterium]